MSNLDSDRPGSGAREGDGKSVDGVLHIFRSGRWEPSIEPYKDWTMDLVDACQERCAESGDPKCLDVEPGCKPCGDCLADCRMFMPGVDPNAVVRPLL